VHTIAVAAVPGCGDRTHPHRQARHNTPGFRAQRALKPHAQAHDPGETSRTGWRRSAVDSDLLRTGSRRRVLPHSRVRLADDTDHPESPGAMASLAADPVRYRLP